MNKAIALFCLLMCYPFFSDAQFSGQLVDADSKKGIPFASIYLIDYQFGTVCDENGKFSFSHELPDNFILRITAPEYDALILPLTIKDNGIAIEMKLSHTEINEVTVSAPRSGLQQRNVTFVDSRNMEELNKIPSTNMGELLQKIPGVYNASTGNGVSKPVVRGLQGMRIVTLLNGVRIESQQWGSDHDIGYTNLGIGSVEVIKGPASLMYGSDAIGGVIYFKDEEYAAQHKVEVKALSGFESNSLGTNSQLELKASGKNIRWTGSGGYLRNSDYGVGSNEFVPNSRFNSVAAKSSLGFNRKHWVSNVRYAYSHQNVGIIGEHHHDEEEEEEEHEEIYVHEQEGRIEVPFQSYDNHLLSWDNKWFKEKGEWQLLLGYGLNGLSEFEEDADSAAMSMKLHSINYTVRNQYRFAKAELFTGFQGVTQLNRNFGVEEELIPDASIIDNGLYAIVHIPLKKWTLQGGGRFDVRYLTTDFTEDSLRIEKTYYGYNFGIGTVRDGEKNTFRINLSSGYRVPHISELLAFGVHHGGQRFEIGNADLVPERAYQIDISDEIHGEHMEVILNPYVNLMQDFVYLKRMDYQLEGYDVYEYQQLPNALLTGLDLAVHYHPHFAHWLHWMPTISLLYADDTKGNAIDRIPPGRFTNELKLTFDTPAEKSEFEAIVEHRYIFAQNRVGELESASTDYHLVNLGFNVSFGSKWRWNTSMGVKNLLDQQYVDHLSGLKTMGISGPGRNFYIRLQVEF